MSFWYICFLHGFQPSPCIEKQNQTKMDMMETNWSHYVDYVLIILW